MEFLDSRDVCLVVFVLNNDNFDNLQLKKYMYSYQYQHTSALNHNVQTYIVWGGGGLMGVFLTNKNK